MCVTRRSRRSTAWVVIAAACAVAAAPRVVAAPSAEETACWPSAGFRDEALKAAQLLVSKNEADVNLYKPDLVLLALKDALRERVPDDQQIKRLVEARANTRRADKQIGASARGQGSTSAAEKPTATSLLGLAIEQGAIQQSVSGTSLTLSTSPYALVAATRKDTAETYGRYGSLARLGVSATFKLDESQSTTLAGKQLSEWSARLRLTPDRTPRSGSFTTYWESNVRGAMQRAADIETGMLADVFARGRAQQERAHALEAIDSAVAALLADSGIAAGDRVAKVENAILCGLEREVRRRVDDFQIGPDTAQRIEEGVVTFKAAQSVYAAARDAADGELRRLESKPILSLGYTSVRPDAGSAYSVLSLLYQGGDRAKLVANAGVSVYHRPDTALKQESMRDVAAALSLEADLGHSPFIGRADADNRVALSLSARYQRLFENRGIAGKKADIALAQLKLEIPLHAAVSLPISVTLANATELIKEKHVRANFGFTIDTDKLFAVNAGGGK
jgi:hypothetical protein